MTPKERASKLAKDMVRAYEVGATMKDLDAVVHFWRSLAEKAIIAAIEEAKAEQAPIAWRPIGTAPKDGTWILLRGRNSVGRPMIPVVVAWSFGHGLSEPPCWRDSASLRDMTSLAASPDGSEWMPLPN